MTVKERPILFNEVGVKSILDGRGTQTRRIVKPQPDIIPDPFPVTDDVKHVFKIKDPASYGTCQCLGMQNFLQLCPYGKPGDRLWVRETWWQAGQSAPAYPDDDEGEWSGSNRVHFNADGNPPNEPNRHYKNGLNKGFSAADPHRVWKKRPSTQMPRWASRIMLEITGIRIERLQEISDADAVAEGVESVGGGRYWLGCSGLTPRGYAARAYKDLWELFNGAGSWSANPWVWVIDFKTIAIETNTSHLLTDRGCIIDNKHSKKKEYEDDRHS